MKKIKETIERIKYLRDPKYHKNNVWSLSAWDSWAAKGQCSGCNCQVCGSKGYNATLENKRHTHQPMSSSTSWMCNDILKVCSKCKKMIEEEIGCKFKTR